MPTLRDVQAVMQAHDEARMQMVPRATRVSWTGRHIIMETQCPHGDYAGVWEPTHRIELHCFGDLIIEYKIRLDADDPSHKTYLFTGG